jgi:hypothetical protein
MIMNQLETSKPALDSNISLFVFGSWLQLCGEVACGWRGSGSLDLTSIYRRAPTISSVHLSPTSLAILMAKHFHIERWRPLTEADAFRLLRLEIFLRRFTHF